MSLPKPLIGLYYFAKCGRGLLIMPGSEQSRRKPRTLDMEQTDLKRAQALL